MDLPSLQSNHREHDDNLSDKPRWHVISVMGVGYVIDFFAGGMKCYEGINHGIGSITL